MKVLCKLLSSLQMFHIIINGQSLHFRVWGAETLIGLFNDEAPLIFKASDPNDTCLNLHFDDSS